jgi:hypothetical protein
VEKEAGPAYLGLAPKVPYKSTFYCKLIPRTYTINDTLDTGFELSVRCTAINSKKSHSSIIKSISQLISSNRALVMSQPLEASRLSNLAARSAETREQREFCSGKAGAQVSQSQPRPGLALSKPFSRVSAQSSSALHFVSFRSCSYVLDCFISC